MATLAELILEKNPRYLWTLCERTPGGLYPNSGYRTTISLRGVGNDDANDFESSGAVCANATPCEGLRFVVQSEA